MASRSQCNMNSDVYLGDRISALPNELLENILSRLTMMEAIDASLISRRWKHLWTYSTGSFDFDYASAAPTAMKRNKIGYEYRIRRFLMLHNGPTIDGFMIKFDLQSHNAHLINSCIEFAIGKRVRRLELDLTPVQVRHEEENWDWRQSLIKNYGYAFPSLHEVKPNLSRLTSLNLKFVNINGKTVEYILSNCTVLEYVCIIYSPGLTGFRVVSECPKLKHLEIAHCHSLLFLEISSAPKLTSFSFSGPRATRLCLQNVPDLVDVSLGGMYCDEIVGRFGDLPLTLSRIRKLKLTPYAVNQIQQFGKFPELKSVTDLELEFKRASDHYSCLSCTYALEGCPNLQKLSVQLCWTRTAEQWKSGKERKGRVNECLKVVEVRGFRGSLTDSELATYIFSLSPFLNNITLDTLLLKSTNRIQHLLARKLASQLAYKFCPAAQLCFL